ncbi:MAG TPA: hypothetical protein VFJ22_16160 [Dermatophilaceae bacterium]|nr:hypothetical protein [Dermatophilaceae bacterium]
MERSHGTLRPEFLDTAGPFTTVQKAQQALDLGRRTTTPTARTRAWIRTICRREGSHARFDTKCRSNRGGGPGPVAALGLQGCPVRRLGARVAAIDAPCVFNSGGRLCRHCPWDRMCRVALRGRESRSATLPRSQNPGTVASQ